MFSSRYGSPNIKKRNSAIKQHSGELELILKKTLPFGSPAEIDNQVKERMKIFRKDGGFVFNSIHNIQAKIPVENLTALFEAIEKYR